VTGATLGSVLLEPGWDGAAASNSYSLSKPKSG
jgi:hypothetical protein